MPIYNTMAGGGLPPNSALASLTSPQQNMAFNPSMSQAVQAPATPSSAGQASGYGGTPLPTSVQGHQGGVVTPPGVSPFTGAFMQHLPGLGPTLPPQGAFGLQGVANGAENASGFGGGQSGFGAFGGGSSGTAPTFGGSR